MLLVLIAVILLAALTYAVTKDSKGSQTILTDEQARLTASDIVQYGDSLRPIIDKMMLLSGVPDTNTSGTGILFDTPGAGIAPLTRELFDSTGGNAPYSNPPPQACNSTCAYVFSGQYTFTGVGSGSNPELALLLIDIPQEVCSMVNVVLGLGPGIPTGGALTVVTPFTGTNYGAATAVTLATSSHALCYQEVGGGRYIYVNVVRAR